MLGTLSSDDGPCPTAFSASPAAAEFECDGFRERHTRFSSNGARGANASAFPRLASSAATSRSDVRRAEALGSAQRFRAALPNESSVSPPFLTFPLSIGLAIE